MPGIVCLRVFATACMLVPVVARPVLAQTADGSGNSVPVNPAPANSNNQPLAVNPITGLGTASAANYQPLTGNERWRLYWKQNYASVGAYFGPVFTALVLDQSTNTPRQWGGGMAGFGRRVGSRTGQAITQGTIQASLAAALHEDVRYISSADTGFKPRLLHAIKFSFFTYNSQGHTTLNIANITSVYSATAISTAWVPIQGSAAKYTFTNGTAQLALAVPINIVQEFWPEIRRIVFRHP